MKDYYANKISKDDCDVLKAQETRNKRFNGALGGVVVDIIYDKGFEKDLSPERRRKSTQSLGPDNKRNLENLLQL